MNTQHAGGTEFDASVIVVTHNNQAFIGECLQCVEASFAPGSCEIVVVDSGSSDRTTAVVREHPSHPALIEMDGNPGFAVANNAGIEASSGRLIVLVNSDAFPDPASIDRLIEAINALPDAGIVGGRLRYPSGKAQPSMGTFPSLLSGLWVALCLHRAPLTSRVGFGVSAHPVLYRARRRVDWVTAAFCIARREVGPLPVGTFMYGEDVEWALACRKAGLAVWFEPSATAVHVGRASVDHSQPSGFAQRRWVQFELAWFGRKGRVQQLAARGVLSLHAALRIVLFAGLTVVRARRDPRIAEHISLLRAALTKRVGPR